MATGMAIMAVIRSARPSFRNSVDKVAFLVHAAFLSSGYVLNSTGANALRDEFLSASSSDEVGIDNWNEVEDCYGFLYTKPEKGKRVIVQCLAMSDELFIDALVEGFPNPRHISLSVGKFVYYKDESSNYGDQFRNLDAFALGITENLLNELDKTWGLTLTVAQNNHSRHFVCVFWFYKMSCHANK